MPGAHAAGDGGVAPACRSGQGPLDEQGFVRIGGIEQWVTVRGDSCANPIILVVHGGPGNPLSPFADALFAGWTKEFTLVQWDQRGAGMTYGRSTPAPDAKLTIRQMTDDGTELAAHLTRRYAQQKVILWGSSWGSVLAVHMAKARPGLFHAYLGTAQIVNSQENALSSYRTVLAVARAADDKASLEALEAVGPPPWTDPRSFGKVRRVIRKFERQLTTPPPATWWRAAKAYATPKAMADHEAGEDYSFVNYVGLKGDGMAAQVDLPRLGADFAIPVFLVQGAQDLLTTPEVTRRYYETLVAPQKALVVVERAGHDPNRDVIDAQYKLLQERIAPLAK